MKNKPMDEMIIYAVQLKTLNKITAKTTDFCPLKKNNERKTHTRINFTHRQL